MSYLAVTALPIALNSQNAVPEWIMLLPAGTIKTVDGRGPYKVANPGKLAIESLRAPGSRLPIDENHATDLAAPNGGPSPARGWIVELQARSDGIWARVEWTVQGLALLAERAYRHISPAFTHLADGTITRVLRASLTNTPNLDLVALNRAQDIDTLSGSERHVIGLMRLDPEAFKRTKEN